MVVQHAHTVRICGAVEDLELAEGSKVIALVMSTQAALAVEVTPQPATGACTTTCWIGTSYRSRASATIPWRNHDERSSGCVAITM